MKSYQSTLKIMENSFIAVLKLTTGEEILGEIEYIEEGVLIKNALIIEELYGSASGKPRGVEISKWIKSTTDEYYFISMEFIITIGELKNPVLSLYHKTLEDLNKPKFNKFNKVKKYTGYRETLDDARIKFENIFKKY